MAATVWLACPRMNGVEAKRLSCLLFWRARRVDAVLVEQKPGFARARAEKILTSSAQRIEPRCPYYQRCGGCHYQHTSYEHQLTVKASILQENLRRIAKLELETELKIHPSPAWNYRNRTRMRVQICPASLWDITNLILTNCWRWKSVPSAHR